VIEEVKTKRREKNKEGEHQRERKAKIDERAEESVSAPDSPESGWRMSDLNLEILAHEMSPLGLLCLRRRELLSQPGTTVTEVTLNREFLMSSLYTESEQRLAGMAFQMHSGNDLRVLVGGLGLGYTARETLLSSRVARVEVLADSSCATPANKRQIAPVS